MKKGNEILANVKVLGTHGNTDVFLDALTQDSRNATKGTLFFAIAGLHSNGHLYIDSAIKKGSQFIVYQDNIDVFKEGVVYVQVENTSVAMGQIAANFYENPSEKLKLIGITGTNGKTTTATLLHQLFLQLGYKSGLISTIKNQINNLEIPTKFTTPDAITFNEILAEMVEQNCKFCFAEVSSHAIAQHRIEGIRFAGGVFTNLTHEHLDFHKTFAEYLKAKKYFFDTLSVDTFALTNADDKNGDVMLQNTKAKKYSYGLHSGADFYAKFLESHIDSSLLDICGHEMWSLLIGEFNAYNLLAVYSTASLLGVNSKDILTTLSNLHPVKGRFQAINKNNLTAIIDYAHTPDALKNVLSTLQKLKKGKANIITCVGAGGDRDKTKRPEMAKIASRKSDKVILTSDNPRTEPPEDILEEMYSGVENENLSKVLKIVNRKEAIRTAIMLAQKNDIILIAGKGHENYQEINGVRSHFDDAEIAIEIMETKTN